MPQFSFRKISWGVLILNQDNMELQLSLTKEEWKEFIPHLTKGDPNSFTTENLREKTIKRNIAIDEFRQHRKELRKDSSKGEDYIWTLPKDSVLHRELVEQLEADHYESIVSNLLKREGRTFYREKLRKLKPPRISPAQEHYWSISKHIFLDVKSFVFQDAMEHLEKEYEKIKTFEDLNQVRFEFHKSLRQVDPLQNPHVEMALWHLLQITQTPFNVLEELILGKDYWLFEDDLKEKSI